MGGLRCPLLNLSDSLDTSWDVRDCRHKLLCHTEDPGQSSTCTAVDSEVGNSWQCISRQCDGIPLCMARVTGRSPGKGFRTQWRSAVNKLIPSQSRDVVALADARATRFSQNGCLSTLVGGCALARDLGLIRVREDRLDAQLSRKWTAVRKVLGGVYLPSGLAMRPMPLAS
eukprot:909728-Amphidinium_carterae.3